MLEIVDNVVNLLEEALARQPKRMSSYVRQLH